MLGLCGGYVGDDGVNDFDKAAVGEVLKNLLLLFG